MLSSALLLAARANDASHLQFAQSPSRGFACGLLADPRSGRNMVQCRGGNSQVICG